MEEGCTPSVAVELSGYYFRSTKPTRLAEYFLPHCKCAITVGQDNNSDISSTFLGLLADRRVGNPFSSVYSIKPRRTLYGGAAKIHFDIGSWLGDWCSWFAHSWLSVFVPVVHVKHEMRPCETLVNGSGVGAYTGGRNATCAFQQPSWNFGKISSCTLKRTGVDDINIKLGVGVWTCEENKLDVYGVVFVPTGNRTRSHANFLFEPVIGAGHVGLGGGINFDYTVWQCYQDFL